MAKFQTGLQHPRLRYALLVLVVGAALVALWSRVSEAPSLKPAAQVAVVRRKPSRLNLLSPYPGLRSL